MVPSLVYPKCSKETAIGIIPDSRNREYMTTIPRDLRIKLQIFKNLPEYFPKCPSSGSRAFIYPSLYFNCIGSFFILLKKLEKPLAPISSPYTIFIGCNSFILLTPPITPSISSLSASPISISSSTLALLAAPLPAPIGLLSLPSSLAPLSLLGLLSLPCRSSRSSIFFCASPSFAITISSSIFFSQLSNSFLIGLLFISLLGAFSNTFMPLLLGFNFRANVKGFLPFK